MVVYFVTVRCISNKLYLFNCLMRCLYILFDNFTKSRVYDDKDSLKLSSVRILVKRDRYLVLVSSKYENAYTHTHTDMSIQCKNKLIQQIVSKKMLYYII